MIARRTVLSLLAGSLGLLGRRRAMAAAEEPFDHTPDNGTYGRMLDRWGLAEEALPRAATNPPGLPKD